MAFCDDAVNELEQRSSGSGHVHSDAEPGGRSFYKLPVYYEYDRANKISLDSRGKTRLLAHINENVIGSTATFSSPYGLRSAVYCDYTASGRALRSFERFIQDQVLPMYGNVHTTTTVTSLQSTLYRHEARDIIRNAVKASEYDAVIFVGNGCTGAVHKLINALGLKSPPIVFISPYEHHSNILPWKELGATVIRIPQDPSGLVDMKVLEAELQKWQPSGRQLIGCFSAASNITGILSDAVGITVLLHQYNALAFWDYATAGPYVDINMNPVGSGTDQHAAHKDAIFISPHKFVGGVDTPGVLVAKKNLFKNTVPTAGGGGSVFFVSREHHRYLKQVEMREEGGTPSIVGAIRAGLAFQLKEAVGTDTIMKREEELSQRALKRWSSTPNLILLGGLSVPRLPIFSFMVRHPHTKQLLHHNFVCAVLNDVFGIQARGGCACAGPYAQDVLGINEELAHQYESLLLEDEGLDRVHLRRYHEFTNREVLRPGFVRLNLPYFMDDECVSFVLDAVAMVAEHGWKLLPQYMFNPETGEWKQTRHQVFQDRRWLGSISYTSGELYVPPLPAVKAKGPLPASYKECLEFSEQIFATAEQKCRTLNLPDHSLLFHDEADQLRWFMLPSEALSLMQGKVLTAASLRPMPFEPPSYPLVGEEFRKVTVIKGSSHHCMSGCGHSAPSHLIGQDPVGQNKENCEHDQQGITRSLSELSMNGGDPVGPDTRENCEDDQQGIGRSLSRSSTIGGDPYGQDNSKNCEDDQQDIGRSLSRLSTEYYATGGSPNEEFCKDNEVRRPCSRFGSSNEPESRDAKSSPNMQMLSSSEEVHASKNGESIHKLQDNNFPRNNLGNFSGKTVAADLGTSGNQSGSCKDMYSTETADQCSTLDISSDRLQMALIGVDSSCPERHIGGNVSEDRVNGLFDVISRIGVGQDQDEINGKPETTPVGTAEESDDTSTDRRSNVRTIPFRNGDDESGRGVNDKVSKVRFHAPPKRIFKPTVQALEEYDMIEDGDRILVCLSGGKDSLSLLHTIKQYQYKAKNKGISFQFGAVTVDPQTPSYDPSPLKGYLAELGVPYFYEEQCIMEQAANLEGGCDSICSFCSRIKRGRIYACARREGYNVLAMGQHLDDLAESFFMSVFHNGLLRTMKANYLVQEGDLRVIRPFVYVREKDLREFAIKVKLPVIPENCPACFEAPKERHRTKQLLASQEILFPRLYQSLLTAMKPLMAKNRTGMESDHRKQKQQENINEVQM